MNNTDTGNTPKDTKQLAALVTVEVAEVFGTVARENGQSSAGRLRWLVMEDIKRDKAHQMAGQAA